MGTFLGTFWALPGRSWGHRDIFGVPRGVRERAGTINFDAPDRPWESLGRFGRPESILGAILGRFWTPIFTPICPPSRRFCRRVRAERHTDRHTLQSKKLSARHTDRHALRSKRLNDTTARSSGHLCKRLILQASWPSNDITLDG